MTHHVPAELQNYVRQSIIPQYANFDKAHQIDHVEKVIEESLKLAMHYEVDYSMVYIIAAYHDLGLYEGREFHHITSGKVLLADETLRRWFTDEQLLQMKEAIEDHRASNKQAPRTIYGMIVAEADRIIDPEVTLRRTVQYGLSHYPEMDKEEQYARFRKHLTEKYAEGGYLKLWIPQSDNAGRLAELRNLITNEDELRQVFNKLYIEEIFNLIPPELNAKNKRFILKRLNENAKFERYQNSFLWLKNAGVALPVYNVEEPKIPLLVARSRNLFKLFQSDVGLLAVQYAEGIQLRIIKGDKDINFGSIYENAVAQELIAHGLEPYYYNNKKRGELDFVVEIGGKVLPIEVKSGKDYDVHHALSNMMDCDEYKLVEAVVFNNDNMRVSAKVIYAPIYMIMFLEKNDVAPIYYKVDLSMLQ